MSAPHQHNQPAASGPGMDGVPNRPATKTRAAQDPDRAAVLQARAGLFSFLCQCLEAEPSPELLELIRGPMHEGLAESGVHFTPQFLAEPAERLAVALDEEFTCLFVAPGCVPPYASVFETGRMFQEPADRALAAYRQAGMTFRPVYSGEFPDHVGVMLGFYAHLLDRENAALAQGRADDAETWKSRREAFLLDEMAGWIPGWCQRARGFAMHEFYDRILALTEAVVWSEAEAIASRQQLRDLAASNQREPVKLDYDADFRKASGL